MFARLRVASFAIVPALFAGPALARTWHVRADHTGDAPTIQAGIDSAQAGDEVVLSPGDYTFDSEGTSGDWMISMKAGIVLRGEGDPKSCVLDAQEQRGVV